LTKSEIEKKLIEETKDLPAEILLEILDFVQYIKIKKSKKNGIQSYSEVLNKELSELDDTSLKHLEAEFSNYKKLYPHEK